MLEVSQRMTAEELASLSTDHKSCELIEGELQMMSPAGGRHGRVAARLLIKLGSHVENHHLGETFAAETGFLLARDPDTVRAPDVAFVSTNRIQGYAEETGFLPLAPDLVAEVVSPSDGFSQVEKKAFAWLAAGVQIVLVVDPESRTVHEYRDASSVRVLHEQETLEAQDIVPGWKIRVSEIFA